MIPPEAVNAVQGTVNLLVDGEYVALQNLTQGKNYDAADLAELVRALGHDLVHPASEAFHDPDVAAVENVVDGRRSIQVDFPLWTEGGRRSDLLLRLTLTEVMERVFGVRIDSIGS
ncbi:hypothetical protein ACFYOT_39555 [Saccharothrix saharensis]|uniref:DUF7668 domain-containing protein n=1 Tax=Saccharothrix saharensis TaxID=571190 RepID=UPI0036D08369